MTKRLATNTLEIWDEEDKPEEAGIFEKAVSEVLKSRVIKTAKRRIRVPDNTSDFKSPFSSFQGFGKPSSTSNAESPFSFLASNKPKTSNDVEKNGTEQNTFSNLGQKDIPSQFKSFKPLFLNSGQQKDSVSNVSSDSTQSNSNPTSTTFKPFEHIFKSTNPSNETNKNSTNLELLKDLNLSCSSWIAEHLQKNPYCILTPIFKDYKNHLIELNLDNEGNENDEHECKGNKLNSMESSGAEAVKLLNVPKEESKESKQGPNKLMDREKTNDFKFGEFQTNNPFNLQFGNVNPSSDSSSTSFNINQTAAKPFTAEKDSKKDDEETEEPPKNDFVPVVEEGSIFDMKCKIFVKKEGNFVSRGIGTLFLKPVKDSLKTQVVVRAHTNLGNILLNVLLSPGTPIQKTGKNNAMIVCIPTPESQPPPVPVLIRVKTSEECDALIKKLEECKGS